ncbi:MAG: hypothetical protein CVV02_00015 [Firmicutes bacterium HGW-Firmicutes-7]|nr:MAG: hypothetical protein CVV02_00015 [Firmicutes bacterium HGW-Firmicutes-7]
MKIIKISVGIVFVVCLILLVGYKNDSENTYTNGDLDTKIQKDTLLKINFNPSPMRLSPSTEDELFQSLSLDMNYTVLENIATHLINEVAPNIILEDNSIPLVEEVSDGYIIGVMETDSTKELSENERLLTNKNPVIYKIGKDGQLLWKQTYDYSFISGHMTNLITYEDGRILFSISNWPTVSMGSPSYEKVHLTQCDQDGNELWTNTYDDYIGSLFKYIFLTENEEIIGLGEWLAIDNHQTLDAKSSDIVVTYIDEIGTIVTQNSFGGENNEYCQGAAYHPGVGVVFTGWTLSKTGDFTTHNSNNNYLDYIACIDESLNLKWVKNTNENERYEYDQMLVKDNAIYTIGYSQTNYGSDEVLNSQVIFWQKLDKNGEEILKQYDKDRMFGGWARLCVLENNYVVIGSGSQNQGTLVIYNNEGEIDSKMDNLEYAPNELIATKGEGFIVKSIREIKVLPQPIYISSIWMDVEVAIMKYNSNFNLEWRKIYDEYNDELRVDFVLPVGCKIN